MTAVEQFRFCVQVATRINRLLHSRQLAFCESFVPVLTLPFITRLN